MRGDAVARGHEQLMTTIMSTGRGCAWSVAGWLQRGVVLAGEGGGGFCVAEDAVGGWRCDWV